MIKKKRITINDIAKLAGVSPTAVSFVINDKQGISDKTRQVVNNVIKTTGYQPNASSLRLSYQRSFNIALLYSSSASPFEDLYYYEIARGLTSRLSEAGLNVVFANLQSGDSGAVLPRILTQNDADGIVIFQDLDSNLINSIDNLSIPYVMVDIHTPDKIHTHISVDSEKSIGVAVDYLISKGHKQIAFVGSDLIPSYYLQCLNGYNRAYEKHDLTINPSWLFNGANDQESTFSCMKKLVNCKQMPTAICCMGDIHAIEAIFSLKELGYAIPEDISIISIDDILLSRYIDPPLTTIGYDKQLMGTIAAELILKKIDGEKADSVIVKSDSIIERKSVRDISIS